MRKINRPKIALIGFSGSGKSHLARLVGGQDLDEVILESSPYETISQWVSRKGWGDFRQAEAEELKDWLESGTGVMAMGGGVIPDPEKATLIWLNTPFEQCLKNVGKSTENRPLFAEERERLKEIYQERQEKYALAPHQMTWEEQLKIQSRGDFLSWLVEKGIIKE